MQELRTTKVQLKHRPLPKKNPSQSTGHFGLLQEIENYQPSPKTAIPFQPGRMVFLQDVQNRGRKLATPLPTPGRLTLLKKPYKSSLAPYLSRHQALMKEIHARVELVK